MSCTTILVGKSASYDGSTIIARDDDSGSGRYDPKRFITVKPEDQPRHYRSVLSHVEIELPDDPYRYTIAPNVLDNRGVLAEAGVNEHNVAMSATETIAVNERVLAADPFVECKPAQGEPGSAEYTEGQAGGIGEEDIITLVLPYVVTAREGVVRFGELLEEYGTYEANGVIFSDSDEIWYIETLGGHHWMARRVPDDCYATIPNQLGIDRFDFADAFGEQHEYMCSADLREFIDKHHLDRTMPAAEGGDFDTSIINPRIIFGTSTTKDHIYNTPRAWYMQRYLNPSEDWDSPDARYTPTSDDIPWCRRPENKITIEDVDFLMASHFEGTPYDPYGTLGTPESRHRYRPIGINRTGHMIAMQIRPYMPASHRAIMWVSFGSGPFTSVAPFYANVTDTPSYLRDTTPEVSTDSLYWTNRLIAALADSHWYETTNIIEQYAEEVRVYGHRLVARTDEELDHGAVSDADHRDRSAAHTDGEAEAPEVSAEESVAELVAADAAAVCAVLETANQEMGEFLRKRTTKLLGDVLYTTSNLMHNSFAMSDRWA